MCVRLFNFNFEKQTNKQKKKKRIQKKSKETKEEKKISPENRLKKKICGRPGEDFSRQPAFPKTRVFYFLALH